MTETSIQEPRFKWKVKLLMDSEIGAYAADCIVPSDTDLTDDEVIELAKQRLIRRHEEFPQFLPKPVHEKLRSIKIKRIV